MPPSAVFYDGRIARRRVVAVSLDETGLLIAEPGTVAMHWGYAHLREQDAPSGCLRLACKGAPELARLEIADADLAAEIRRRCPAIGRAVRANRAGRIQVVGWSVAAAVSLILTAVYLVPLAADRVTPLIPRSVERRLGDAVDNQVRAIFRGRACTPYEGRVALAAIQRQLLAGAPAGLAIDIVVLPSPIVNAFALPGGRIYLLRGLIDKADNGAEVAGVLAHEIGHVVHRDAMRRLLQSSGSSFLIGLLFGDVVGGGTLITLGQTLVNSAYSREQEAAADDFAADLFLAIGQSPRTLGAFLSRIAETPKGGNHGLSFLQSHPLSQDRIAALAAKGEPARPAKPLLSAAQWQALKTICAPAKE
jgi:predicted Zn-dependent protease